MNKYLTEFLDDFQRIIDNQFKLIEDYVTQIFITNGLTKDEVKFADNPVTFLHEDGILFHKYAVEEVTMLNIGSVIYDLDCELLLSQLVNHYSIKEYICVPGDNCNMLVSENEFYRDYPILKKCSFQKKVLVSDGEHSISFFVMPDSIYKYVKHDNIVYNNLFSLRCLLDKLQLVN